LNWPLWEDDCSILTQMTSVYEKPKEASSHPWLALGLTFLLLGLGYGLPFALVRTAPAGLWQGKVAPEVLNLYALTAFAGWAHFVFAWRGQWAAIRRLRTSWRVGYFGIVVAALGALIGLRSWLGVGLFSALAWIWFIGHFVKAEVVFSGVSPTAGGNSSGWHRFRQRVAARFTSGQPVVAFAWLSLVLFDVGNIQEHRWMLFTGCLILGGLMLAAGGWAQLSKGSHRLPLVALFFLGESLVWGTYGPYMTPAFRIGVYVFHVAGASFFHYLGSYFFGRERTGDRWLGPWSILAVNLGMIFLGWAVAAAWLPLRVGIALSPVLGIGWFTLWVALHQAASDLLPVWKRAAVRP
jgi:hypothetical protein